MVFKSEESVLNNQVFNRCILFINTLIDIIFIDSTSRYNSRIFVVDEFEIV